MACCRRGSGKSPKRRWVTLRAATEAVEAVVAVVAEEEVEEEAEEMEGGKRVRSAA